jgi:hypothetical protein
MISYHMIGNYYNVTVTPPENIKLLKEITCYSSYTVYSMFLFTTLGLPA